MPRRVKKHTSAVSIEGMWHIGRSSDVSTTDAILTALLFSSISRASLRDVRGDADGWHINIHHALPPNVEPAHALRRYADTTAARLKSVFPRVRYDLHVVGNDQIRECQ